MDVTVRTMAGDEHKVRVEADALISDLKRSLAELLSHPEPQLLLCCDGAVMFEDAPLSTGSGPPPMFQLVLRELLWEQDKARSGNAEDLVQKGASVGVLVPSAMVWALECHETGIQKGEERHFSCFGGRPPLRKLVRCQECYSPMTWFLAISPQDIPKQIINGFRLTKTLSLLQCEDCGGAAGGVYAFFNSCAEVHEAEDERDEEDEEDEEEEIRFMPRKRLKFIEYLDVPGPWSGNLLCKSRSDVDLAAAGTQFMVDYRSEYALRFKGTAMRRWCLGGFPTWYQGHESISCHRCHQQMSLLLSIEDAQDGWGQVYACPHCDAEPSCFFQC
eukprot:TRINITY_DN25552_c0_g1_i1.p1 TRINITY_DN25552_c0_g1~~TRINITY_DN25552_c0_g1_i1.p1  ORF type:complete len:331 (-),score=39.42 TRINITY_DN25552_c0_g1_i1:159-1151(-)